jgi:hypothetical protein
MTTATRVTSSLALPSRGRRLLRPVNTTPRHDANGQRGAAASPEHRKYLWIRNIFCVWWLWTYVRQSVRAILGVACEMLNNS